MDGPAIRSWFRQSAVRHPARSIYGDPDALRDFDNRVSPYTNLHVHGLHVSPSGNADKVLIEIPAGQTFHYSFQFPKTLRPGTYWYHSHADPISAPQVAGGLSGITIVDGLRQYLPPETSPTSTASSSTRTGWISQQS